MIITKEEFITLMSHELNDRFCVEIDFAIKNDPVYSQCCMGKMPKETSSASNSYWYGLTPDGTQSYDYDTLHELCNASVFYGQSLFDIWDRVVF